MRFYEATYSGVTWLQVAVGWIGMAIFAALAVWGWVYAISQKNRADLWEDIDARNTKHLQNLIETLREKIQALVDNKLSLEARLNRVISRPRGEDGRFQKK